MNSEIKKAVSPEDIADLRALYLEVIAFLNGCGGVYRHVTGLRCARILYCLDHGMYLLKRDKHGNISQFVAYWRIRQEDIPTAKLYQRPHDILTGTTILTVDFASTLGLPGIMRMFHDMLPQQEPLAVELCFEHKGRFITFDKKGNARHPWKLRR